MNGYQLVRHPMKVFYYLDDQWMIHFDLIENYKHVIVGLALAGSEVMSFCGESSAKLVKILYLFLRGRYTYDLEVVEVEMVDIVVLEAYRMSLSDSVNQSFLVVDWMVVHLLVAYFLDYTVRFQTVLVVDR